MDILEENAKIIVTAPFIFVWDFLKSVWFFIGDIFVKIGNRIVKFFTDIELKISNAVLFLQGIVTRFIEYRNKVINWVVNSLMKWIAAFVIPLIAITLDMIFDLLKGVVYKFLSLPGDLINTNIKRAFGGTGSYNAANTLTGGLLNKAVKALVKVINLPLSGIKAVLDTIPSISDLI